MVSLLTFLSFFFYDTLFNEEIFFFFFKVHKRILGLFSLQSVRHEVFFIFFTFFFFILFLHLLYLDTGIKVTKGESGKKEKKITYTKNEKTKRFCCIQVIYSSLFIYVFRLNANAWIFYLFIYIFFFFTTPFFDFGIINNRLFETKK